jgi:ribosomal-protein-alanine N-acetyltransferase
VEIRTPRLILREFTALDLPPLQAQLADPRHTEFYGPGETDAEFARDLLERCIRWAEESPRCNYQLAIALSEAPDDSIGSCGIRQEGCEAGAAEFGLQLAAEHWGRGLATEAARAMLRLAFEDLGLREVRGVTVTENARVQSLVTRLGFTKSEIRPGPDWMRARGWSQTVWRLCVPA